MSLESYWIGKGLNLDELWQDFDSGSAYMTKFDRIESYLLRLTFGNHPKQQPLFDHEVIYKTIKGTFHDVKAGCLSPNEYLSASPIFLYRVERGSGIFEFLAQFDPLLTYVAAIAGAMMWYRRVYSKDQEIDERKWKFIRSEFPRASTSDVQKYMKAWTTWGRRRILHRLIAQGLQRIEVSREPFDESQETTEMVDISKHLERGM